MTDSGSKWFDPETFSDDDSGAIPLRAIHKKIEKKHDNIAKGLREYKESLIGNKDRFLGWAKAKKPAESNAAKLLTTASNFVNAKAELTIKKIFQTDKRDSIGATVQALDYCAESNTFAYAGFDKVLKLLAPNAIVPKGYEVVSSVFFENLPIQGAKFAGKDSVLLNYQNKKFISLYDVPSQKPVHFYKLFSTQFDVHKTIINKNGLAVVSNAKELSLFDANKKITTLKTLQSDTVKDLCFIGESDIGVAYENDNVKIYDIRVSMNRPKNMIKRGADILASNGAHLVTGNRNGIVTLYDASTTYESLKTYDNLTTEISSISCNGAYIAFCSKWVNNAVRVIDLRDLNVMQSWPNVKTRLNVVNRMLLTEHNHLVCGTAKGSLETYVLKLSEPNN